MQNWVSWLVNLNLEWNFTSEYCTPYKIHKWLLYPHCIPMRMYLAPFTVDVELFQINVQHIKMYTSMY